MRSIKFKLSRKALNNVYTSYLRPVLEYASVVWDGCTLYEKIRLEQIQYEAARFVTGLTRSVSIDKLVKEIGWLPLSERCLFQKSVLMYKIKNGLAPEYLCNLMPPLVADRTVYNLRNIALVSRCIYYCMGRAVTNVDRTCGPTHLLVFSGNKICLN